MTLAGVKARYASGLSPEELVGELREKAIACSEYNIFIHLLSNEELAPYFQRLNTCDQDSMPLWGVPFVIKDNIDLAGVDTTAGCEAFRYRPDSTAFVAQQLIDKGAIPLGKANLDQFATGLNGTRSPWGACRNSFDPSLISGGSSSGSAVAVALGLATFSLGTDTAGSGRIPAAFNNLVGVKPSRGLLSTSGVVPACRTLDCVSIFALHCDDANEVLLAAEGLDKSDCYSRANCYDNRAHSYGHFSSDLRLGIISGDDLKFFGNAEYRSAYEATLDKLDDAGVHLVTIDYAPFDEVARLLYEGPWVTERYVAIQSLIKQKPETIFPVVRDIIASGATASAADLFKAQYRLQDLRQQCYSILESIDALMTPTAGTHFSIKQLQAEPLRCNNELGYYMNFVNLLDMAAVAVPTAITSSGLPFGVTLSAAAFTDRRLLSIANFIHSQTTAPLGTSETPKPALNTEPYSDASSMELVVCGAHLKGLPLNHQLTERGATLVQKTTTTEDYRLYALHEVPIQRPALIRTSEGGSTIEVEVWKLPAQELGSFLNQIASPLGLGKVQLVDGKQVTGFIAEPLAVTKATEITEYGGWRAYLQHRK